ncbi:MAG TPA: aminoacyl-tRNA hydrolase [Gemmatimonadales bacterium]|nr:aminoacyl-tRNA hydrolase [Gemmatimonadales bacterium]
MVGLGNPGSEYENTRHNAGFRLVDRLVERWQIGPFRRVDRAREARGHWKEFEVTVLKPQTYMNRSGAVVASLRSNPEFDPSRHLLIVVDDVALPLGRFRLRGAGSAGGHNGLKSIEGALQRQDYPRLRIGVGPAPPDLDNLADYVLDEFTPDERDTITALLDPMCEAVECWLEHGIEVSMNRFNR